MQQHTKSLTTTPKTALIIGGSRGLGTELALKAVENGYHVILVGRNRKALMTTDDRISAIGGTATLIPFDLRNVNLIDQLVLSIAGRFPQLDLIIFNAAYSTELRPIAHTPNEQWDDVIAANLTAPMRLLRALDPLIRKSTNPHLVMVTDNFTDRPLAFWGAYAVAKAGLQRLAEIYTSETTSSCGLKVSFFDPGPMPTELRRKAFPGEDASQMKPTAEIANEFWNNIDTGRVAA